ncbi:hypothetical protein RFI_05699 [Reticulomyxa filosa]|uniref:UBZ4-type domain-containing protein n=1 Tax=Reticulomyxa filosa TaxID=46433 RepID=X6NZX4_RETFI|nr:hypothetical protein RFI_05699 [Reticulomyxa filosa]|eukprot:ETO31418.1 hypothetical protein RFI_05699 [Reticulomyxa filosa]
MSKATWSSFMAESQKNQKKDKDLKSVPRMKGKNADSQQRQTKKRPLEEMNGNTDTCSAFSLSSPISKRRQVECPICKTSMLDHLLNIHLDIDHATSKEEKKKTDESEEKKEASGETAKVCPLFLKGALPASAFEKKKGPRNNGRSAQKAIFYLSLKWNDEKSQIESWTAEWICDSQQDLDATLQGPNMHLHAEVDLSACLSLSLSVYVCVCVCVCVYVFNMRAEEYSEKSDADGGSIDLNISRPTPFGQTTATVVPRFVAKAVHYHFGGLGSAYRLCRFDVVHVGGESTLHFQSISIVVIVIVIVIVIVVNVSNSVSGHCKRPLWLFNFVFSLVKKCSSCQWKDYVGEYLYGDNDVSSSQLNLFSHALQSQLSHPALASNLVRCILIRASYGGMKGDILMLRNYAKLWAHRFGLIAEHHTIPCISSRTLNALGCDEHTQAYDWLHFIYTISKTPRVANKQLDCSDWSIDARQISPLQEIDVILSSVDFHCSRLLEHLQANTNVLQIIQQWTLEKSYSVSNPQQLLKTMVWEFRSSLTDKEPLGDIMWTKPEELRDLWQQIHKFVDDYAFQFLKFRIK